MRTDVTWDEGAASEVLSFRNDWLVVQSTKAQAPGKPWRGSLANGAFVGLKVKSCKKQPGGLFVIEGPSFDLTRETRQALLALVQPPIVATAGANDQTTEPPADRG